MSISYHCQPLKFVPDETPSKPDEAGRYSGEYIDVVPEEASMWSVYRRNEDDTVEVIADFAGPNMQSHATKFTELLNEPQWREWFNSKD